MNLTRSAIAKSISKLEQRLGLRLFIERHGNKALPMKVEFIMNIV
ncbi:LysR family transcriptional regulator [Acinetobacter baumannii]